MKVKFYLHTNKDQNWQLGEELGLKEEALRMFRYALYEVEIDAEVDEDTGRVISAELVSY